MERHFTATAYVLHDNQVLLHRHPKMNKWLPAGGHLEENETPPECALREALEETGLLVKLIREEHLWVDDSNAKSFERPFLCLLENIPAHGLKPAHQHIDFIYLARPLERTLAHKSPDFHWFTLSQVLALNPNDEIFAETQETIRAIFRHATFFFSGQQPTQPPLPAQSG